MIKGGHDQVVNGEYDLVIRAGAIRGDCDPVIKGRCDQVIKGGCIQ